MFMHFVNTFSGNTLLSNSTYCTKPIPESIWTYHHLEIPWFLPRLITALRSHNTSLVHNVYLPRLRLAILVILTNIRIVCKVNTAKTEKHEPLLVSRDHSGCGLGQYDKALHSNASSRWLGLCPDHRWKHGEPHHVNPTSTHLRKNQCWYF